MSNAMSRGLAVLEQLAGHAEGLPLADIARGIDVAPSVAHRTLAHLVQEGYVRQTAQNGHYILSLRVVSLALRHLSKLRLVELARPVLDELASRSGALARLSIVDNESLVWVAKAQGATSGLRYDPDEGSDVQLSCTASGLAWLSTMTDDHALRFVLRQGFANRAEYGPTAPRTIEEFSEQLHRTRDRGYATVHESFEPGTSAMAAPITRRDGSVSGVLSIAGPQVNLTEDKMTTLAPTLLERANQVADTGILDESLR